MADIITKLSDLIDPEVMADMVSARVPKKMRVAPFAKIDDTLAGVQPNPRLSLAREGVKRAATEFRGREARASADILEARILCERCISIVIYLGEDRQKC